MSTFINEYEIIGANPAEGGWNLYTPRYGDTFVGNFDTLDEARAAAVEAAEGQPLVVHEL